MRFSKCKEMLGKPQHSLLFTTLHIWNVIQ